MQREQGVLSYYRGISGGDDSIEIHQRIKVGLIESVAPKIFEVVITKEDEGGYSAYSPEVKGARTQGEDESETLRNMFEAIQLVLEARGQRTVFTLTLKDAP